VSEVSRIDEKAPFEVGAFTKVFDPSVGEGQAWYVNDHCFVRGGDGQWRLIGITHAEPANPLDEKHFLHAVAPDLFGPWTKEAPALRADSSCGETHLWAPHILEHEGRYWMFYCAGGRSSAEYRIHLATSQDLASWERHAGNPLIVDGFDARDPMVLRLGSDWVLYYTATSAPDGGHHVVKCATSPDLLRWSQSREAFRHSKVGTYGGPTESPFVVRRGDRFYLFVCTNDPYNDTAVYESRNPFRWDESNLCGRFPAHAAEVVELADGRSFVSRCGWGQGGVYLARLVWADGARFRAA